MRMELLFRILGWRCLFRLIRGVATPSTVWCTLFQRYASRRKVLGKTPGFMGARQTGGDGERYLCCNEQTYFCYVISIVWMAIFIPYESGLEAWPPTMQFRWTPILNSRVHIAWAIEFPAIQSLIGCFYIWQLLRLKRLKRWPIKVFVLFIFVKQTCKTAFLSSNHWRPHVIHPFTSIYTLMAGTQCEVPPAHQDYN